MNTEPTAPAFDVPTDSGMWTRPSTVAQWLLAQGVTAEAPLTIKRVGIGQSNITTLVVDTGGREWVMREPPMGTAAGSTHNLDREVRILRALAHTGVPVPPIVGTGVSPAGTPFMVMERIVGSALETEEDARSLTGAQRHALGTAVAATLAALHSLDPAILGIRVSTDPYLVRQIKRVTGAWDRVRALSRHDADWTAVRDRLADRLPENPPATIMHGDYRLSNLLVADGRITAVLDWELCTVGDPLADLAWLLDDWRAPTDPAFVMPSPTRAGGFPDRSEMITIYRDITGRPVDDLDYYRAFSQWRAASLLEGVRFRRMSGAMGSHAAIDADELEDSIGVLLESAAEQLRRAA